MCIETRKYYLQIAKTLSNPSIFFSNPNCFDTACPTDPKCENSWTFNLLQYDVDIVLKPQVDDSSVKLKCISMLDKFISMIYSCD